jgi:plasmid stabilization system protein ParE
LPRLIVTAGAVQGLERRRLLLSGKNPEAARRAGQAITRHFSMPETAPAMGRPFDDQPELRELLIPFGDSGYVALYRHEAAQDTVYVLAFRHQKETGYRTIPALNPGNPKPSE